MNPAIDAANFVTNADCRKKLTDGWDVIVGIVSMFVGVGEVSAILKGMNAVKAAELLQKAAQIADKFNIVGRMMSKAGLAISKKGTKAASFVIRKASNQVPTVVFDYANGVYKGFKQKTAAFKKYLGTIEGQVEFTNGTKGKGTIELWGACGTSSSARSTGPDFCDDVAGRLLKKALNKLKKVELNSTDLAKKAIQHRENAPQLIGKNRNFCVFEYEDLNGKTDYIYGVSGKNIHSEKHAMDQLETLGIPPGKIKRVYTELEPCSLSHGGDKDGTGCAGFLAKKGLVDKEIQYSYEYPGGDNDSISQPIREKSVSDKAEAIEKLVKRKK
ncbi:nucleic acid/nucleotide deaminase domain-containing protein [Emticicia sp. 17c]|uniref:nucleic acid/nucleotide deaminase domain-containing protein n=1 Tax=Emticicia sp. 17c TaxID=3127704 RepID=UPI00301E22D3